MPQARTCGPICVDEPDMLKPVISGCKSVQHMRTPKTLRGRKSGRRERERERERERDNCTFRLIVLTETNFSTQGKRYVAIRFRRFQPESVHNRNGFPVGGVGHTKYIKTYSSWIAVANPNAVPG